MSFLKGYRPEILSSPHPIPIEHFVEFHLDKTIEYQKLSYDNSVLGMITFNDGMLTVLDSYLQPKIINTEAGTIIVDDHLVSS